MLLQWHTLSILFTLSTIMRHCSATTCLVCSSSTSNEDCNSKGVVRKCRPFEVCENRVISYETRKVITKRCTPRRSCSDRCRGRGATAVCGQCCRFDNCNQDLLAPSSPPRQQRQRQDVVNEMTPSQCDGLFLSFVAMRCARLKSGNEAGTTCLFWCTRHDYVLSGPSRLTCLQTSEGAKWSGTLPTCARTKMTQNHRNPGACSRLDYDDETTEMVCTNEFNFRSTCTFSCKDGYYMLEAEGTDVIPSGVRKSVCWRGVQDPVVWTRPPPRCLKKKCPILVREDFSIAYCTNWIRVGSVCDFSCLPGFYQIGPRFVSCEDVDPEGPVAVWNDTVPTCEPRKCRELELPSEIVSNCTDGVYFRSECSFRCEKGYYMTAYGRSDPLTQNEEISACKVSRKNEMVWRPHQPSCVLKSCPEIPLLTDGNINCSNGIHYMSVCSFTCSDAFLLAGKARVTCIERGSGNSPVGAWDADIPWCRPKRCDPLKYNDENVEVSCTDSVNYASTCTFTCKVGYFMTTQDGLSLVESGKSTTKCVISEQRTLMWEAVAPLCHLKSCKELRNPANGLVFCSDENNHGSTCAFSCSAGYVLRGEKTLTCKDTGSHIPRQTWDYDLPWCKAKPCPNVVYNSGTTNLKCTDGASFRSICTFKCKEGHYMTSPTTGEVQGNFIAVCVLNDASELEWSADAPECLAKTCAALSAPTSGGIKCVDSTKFDSVCIFSCNPGYEPNGRANLRCVDDGYNKKEGVWSHSPPSCTRRSCPAFKINIDIIGFICDGGMRYESKCEFRCMEGHYMTRGGEIVGSATTTCDVVGNAMKWTSAPPDCNLKSCPAVPKPERGLLRCNEEFSFGSTCMIMCTPGFYLSGERAIKCEDNGINDPLGAWSSEIPSCERKPCPERELTGSSKLIERCSNGYLFESKCNYSCEAGYYMSNSEGVTNINKMQVKCGVSGRVMSWSSNLPTCILKTCPVIRIPENGNAFCTDTNNFGSTCDFTCHKGYIRTGNVSAACRNSEENEPVGTWTSQPPTCEPRSCKRFLYDVESLTMVCSAEQKINSVCEFACRTGYYAAQEDEDDFLLIANTTCVVHENDEMVWSRKAPKCRVKSCEPHGVFENGKTVCTDGVFYKSTCSFKCSPGFKLLGESVSECTDVNRHSKYGNWSAAPPVCERRPCPTLEYDEITTSVNCTSTNLYQSVCNFFCLHGYYMTSLTTKKIIDLAKTRCDVRSNNMYWTEAAPRCVMKRCSKARAPEDGEVLCDAENYFKSECSFSCSVIRELHGEKTLKCDADDRNVPQGRWDAAFPTCELRSCPDLEIDKRAIGETCNNFYKYSSRCIFSCNEGFYTPIENKTTTENFSEAECGINGTVMTWTGNPPVCEIKTCLSLMYPGNGTYKCSDASNFDTKCNFKCVRGFLLIGKRVLRCKDDGTDGPMGVWNGEEPVCEPRSCKELVYDPDTQEVECSYGIKYGSACAIKCKEGYYMTARNGIDLIDNASAVCDVNPRNNRAVLWKHDEPRCFLKTCLDLTPPTDGSVTCEDGTAHGSKCVYKCLPGFQMVGLATTSCKDDGQNIPTGIWSKEAPICEPKSCARLVNNENTTNYECTDGWKYRSVCTFTCNKGYFITKGDGRTIVKSGNTTTECGRGSGEGMAWTNQLPNCLSKYCLVIRPRKNMTITCTDKFKYNTRCAFACDPPLELVGPPVLTCIDDEKSAFSGKWDGRHWGLRCKM